MITDKTYRIPSVLFTDEITDALLVNCRVRQSQNIIILCDDKITPPTGLKIARTINITVVEEPTTSLVDSIVSGLSTLGKIPDCIIGIGGGTVLDITKAVSVLLTHTGRAEQYQGWDTLIRPGIYSIGIPTLFGSGAECSRTAVLTSSVRKLGINSEHVQFNDVIVCSKLAESAPMEQIFYTGMDCYIHCIESMHGTHSNNVYVQQSMTLCEEYFSTHSRDMNLMSHSSFLGGVGLLQSKVGICHAISYGLGFVMKIPHGLAVCLIFNQLSDIYGESVSTFKQFMREWEVTLPDIKLSPIQIEQIIEASVQLDMLWKHTLGKKSTIDKYKQICNNILVRL